MCIIVAKESGVAFPSKRTLQNCFTSNPDGAGFMFVRDGKVQVRKGFMSFPEFWTALKSEKLSHKNTIVYHFRIGTSGTSDGSACHPFPVTDNVNTLKSTQASCDMAMVHNGVFGPGSGGLSDTMLFVRDILSDAVIRDNINKPSVQQLLTGYIGTSKLAVLTPSTILYFGKFITDKGIKYSNSGYMDIAKPHWSGHWGNAAQNTLYQDFRFPYSDDGPADQETEIDPDDSFDCPECGGIVWVFESLGGVTYECDTCGTIYDAIPRRAAYGA